MAKLLTLLVVSTVTALSGHLYAVPLKQSAFRLVVATRFSNWRWDSLLVLFAPGGFNPCYLNLALNPEIIVSVNLKFTIHVVFLYLTRRLIEPSFCS